MIKYKIEYKIKGSDNWIKYNNVEYTDFDEAESVLKEADEQFPSYRFRINSENEKLWFLRVLDYAPSGKLYYYNVDDKYYNTMEEADEAAEIYEAKHPGDIVEVCYVEVK